MEKFTLDEAFDIAYKEMLDQQVSDDIKSLREEYTSEINEFIDAINILEDQDHITSYHGGIIFGGDPEEDKDNDDDKEDKSDYTFKPQNPRPVDSKNKTDRDVNNKKKSGSGSDDFGAFTKALELYDKMNDRAAARTDDMIKKIINNRNEYNSYPEYTAQPQFVEITSAKDLPFPKNLIFFITQLITWIKRHILNFIDKFSNIIRSLLGLKAAEPKYSKEDLAFKMSKAKTLETKFGVVTDSNAYKRLENYSDKLNDINGYDSKTKYTSAVAPVKLLTISPSDVKLLSDDFKITEDQSLTEADNQPVKVISIDTSTDLYNLKLSLQHFFDLFDNAFGSNDEKLFDTDDVMIVLELIKDAANNLKKGSPSVPELEVNGALTSNNIDSKRIRDNLIRTKINIDNLKKAYVTTNQQINIIAKIIMNKNLIGVSQMGVQYAFLSSASYKELSELAGIVENRLDEAKQIEKKLVKVKGMFENLTKELEKKRSMLSSVKNFAVTSIAQRNLENLYDSSRYMTQVIQLRLNALTLYVSELDDTRAIIKNMTAITESNLKTSFVSKLKNLFKK